MCYEITSYLLSISFTQPQYRRTEILYMSSPTINLAQCHCTWKIYKVQFVIDLSVTMWLLVKNPINQEGKLGDTIHHTLYTCKHRYLCKRLYNSLYVDNTKQGKMIYPQNQGNNRISIFVIAYLHGNYVINLHRSSLEIKQVQLIVLKMFFYIFDSLLTKQYEIVQKMYKIAHIALYM